MDDTGADGNQNTPITLSIDDAASDDTYDALPDQTVTVTTTDDEPPSSTSGDVDGDSDFDASDAFLIHLIDPRNRCHVPDGTDSRRRVRYGQCGR